MSLSLVQDYSSEEDARENVEEYPVSDEDDVDSEDDGEQLPPSDNVHISVSSIHSSEVSESVLPMASSSSSLLPSPEALFSEVTGPPEFLKSSATEPLYTRANNTWQPSPGTTSTPVYRTDPVTDPAQGVVLETQVKSSGSHNQVQADSDGGNRDGKDRARSALGAGTVVRESITASPRLYTAPEAKDSAAETEKRNRSKIKDKEKSKRMKGQSSHATWKSETEMHLRQHFD